MATTIALLSKDTRAREMYLAHRTLPLNYMEDFSILGFIVDRYSGACSLLAANGYNLQEYESGSDLLINGPEQIRDIDRLLRAGNIQATFTDIADTIYQA